VEGGAGVAETFFAGTEGSKVFAGFGGNVGVEFEGDSAGWLAADFHVEVASGHFDFVGIFWLKVVRVSRVL